MNKGIVPIVPTCPKLFSEIVQPEEFHRRIYCQSAPISHMFPSPSSFRANINLTYLAHIDSIALPKKPDLKQRNTWSQLSTELYIANRKPLLGSFTGFHFVSILSIHVIVVKIKHVKNGKHTTATIQKRIQQMLPKWAIDSDRVDHLCKVSGFQRRFSDPLALSGRRAFRSPPGMSFCGYLLH